MAVQGDSLLGRSFDEYRIERPLGAGGMAKVYRALDVKLKRYVALKVIAPDLRNKEQYAERFEREAQSIARLEHANIVRIYRFGEADEMFYMAMQYVEGADLGTLIRGYKALGEVMPTGDVQRVLQDIGGALDYAHSRDVIHRDVKPSNVMVDNTGQALLADFGLALLADLGTRGEVLGSPHYVAPEQAISSSDALPQSDLYSLGISLFEMLTGDVPFTGDQVVDVIAQHINQSVPPPSRLNGAIPPSVDEVVLRATAKDPYERFQTGSEMAAAFRDAVDHWQENEHPVSRVVRRPSLVLLPQRVHTYLEQTAESTLNEPVSRTATTAPIGEIPTQTAPTHGLSSEALPTTGTKSPWRGALVFSAIIFVLGLGIVLALSASRGNVAVPTPTAADEVAVVPTVTSNIVSTNSAEVIVTQMAGPTLLPTAAPVEIAAIPTYTARYALLISRHGDNSLYVMNLTLDPFPVAPLRLGTENTAIAGSEWGVEHLDNGNCISVWRASGDFLPPDALCTVIGMRVPRDGAQVFWGAAFGVYYNDVLVAMCEQENCLVRINV